MTDKETIQAILAPYWDTPDTRVLEQLCDLLATVRAEENEWCAQLLEEKARHFDRLRERDRAILCRLYAASIRARLT